MNARMYHSQPAPIEIETDPEQSIPIKCPACSAPLGTITAEAAGISQQWERERIPLAVPHVDPARLVRAELARGACPSCATDLAGFVFVFRRIRGSDNPEQPRLSIAVHGKDAWAMLERRVAGVEVVEHAIGPVLDRDASTTFSLLRQILPVMSSLPRDAAA